MLNLILTHKFKKDLKKILKSGVDMSEIEFVVNKLQNKEILDEKFNNHKLSGKYKGCCDCHIRPDLVLIYKSNETTLSLVRLGSHSELF